MRFSKHLITMGVAVVALAASGMASATNGYMTQEMRRALIGSSAKKLARSASISLALW